MKRFLINLLLFAMIGIGLNQALNLLQEPFFGNRHFSGKFVWYQARANEFNTIVLGSSRMQSQVDPKILNQTLHNWDVKAFNLAAPGSFNPEAYWLYESLLRQSQPGQLKFAFLELQPLYDFEGIRLSAAKNYYWQTPANFWSALNHLWHSPKPLTHKALLSSNYLTSFAIGIVNPKGAVELIAGNPLEPNSYLGPNHDGYYALDSIMGDLGGDNAYQRRYNIFLANKDNMARKTDGLRRRFSEKDISTHLNSAHLNKALELIRLSKERGVHLVWVIPPLGNDYQELLAIAARLPDRHVIEIANPTTYPELYQFSHLFDGGHLNRKGAEAFTSHLARGMIAILNRPSQTESDLRNSK